MIPAVLGVGLLLGWGLGGGLRNLADVRIRLWPLLPIALVLQAIPISRVGAGRVIGLGMLLLSYVLLLAVVLVNRRVSGFTVIFAGLLLNTAVIAANGSMPVSASAAASVGGIERLDDLRDDSRHHVAEDDDLLLPLADVIALGPPFRLVISAGDALMYAGASWFLAAAMLGLATRRSPPRPLPARRATGWETPR